MFKTIPIRLMAGADRALRSGEKFTTPQGFTAIKNGVKGNLNPTPAGVSKPGWTGAAMPGGARFDALRELVDRHGLSTVCKEARCPNIGECWNSGTATLMLLGSVCTRACRFCAVDTGNPRGWTDPDEPAKVARTVAILGLRYVVLTSVNRDDLPDGGAGHFAATVAAIRHANTDIEVEALTPDFGGRLHDVDQVLRSGIVVFAQNIETVRRLTVSVRDPRAGYDQTLSVLRHASAAAPDVRVKSSLMLGLGETDDEIFQTLVDLHVAGTRIVTIGQYLQPTRHHLPVRRWVPPEEFDSWRLQALELGFHACMAGPLVRSSYRAHTAMHSS